MPDPMKPAAAVINHLLAQEPWARKTLAAHAGKLACIDTGAMQLRLKVAADGYVQDAPPTASARCPTSSWKATPILPTPFHS
jgi:ubiquinone biosynthesis accessory factor UbiJ